MKRTLGIVITGLALIASTGCMTRSKHAAVIATWEDKLQASQAEQARLRGEKESALSAKDREIAGIRGDLAATKAGARSRQAELSASLEASQEEIAALRKQRARIEANLKEYRKLEEAFKRMIGAGELRIYRRHGRVMVALPSSVLFPSGSADLSPNGKKAVAEVAGVLSKVEGRRFLVAGHTDNVPIKTATFMDNWALSTARATVVTRDLIANGMKPTILAAAGYGEYDPIRRNNSPANRQKNRRIEIILMPNIDELPPMPK